MSIETLTKSVEAFKAQGPLIKANKKDYGKGRKQVQVQFQRKGKIVTRNQWVGRNEKDSMHKPGKTGSYDIGSGIEVVGISRDANGNKTVKIKKPGDTRVTSIQTNGAMPSVHRLSKEDFKKGLPKSAAKEILSYYEKHLKGKQDKKNVDFKKKKEAEIVGAARQKNLDKDKEEQKKSGYTQEQIWDGYKKHFDGKKATQAEIIKKLDEEKGGNARFYEKQLNEVFPADEYGVHVQIHSSSGKTKNMKLTPELVQQLKDYRAGGTIGGDKYSRDQIESLGADEYGMQIVLSSSKGKSKFLNVTDHLLGMVSGKLKSNQNDSDKDRFIADTVLQYSAGRANLKTLHTQMKNGYHISNSDYDKAISDLKEELNARNKLAERSQIETLISNLEKKKK